MQKPSRVDLVGSYLLKTAIKPLQNVDIAIEIPTVSWSTI